MKRVLLIISALLILVLAACSAQSEPEQSAENSDGPIVTVFRAPT